MESHRRIASVALGGVWLFARIAGGAPADVARPALASLEWMRARHAERCLDGSTLAAGVEQVLGRRVFAGEREADVRVRGRIDRDADGWVAHLDMRDREGRPLGVREVRRPGVDCEPMRTALVVIVAVMVDLPRVQRAPASEGPSWRIDAGVGIAERAGLLPGLTPGVGAVAILEPPRFAPLALAASFWPARDAAQSGAVGRFSGWDVGIASCPRLSGGHLALCVGGRTGVLRAEGLDLELAAARRLHAVMEVEAAYTLSLGGALSLRVGAGVLVPLVRDRFVFTDAQGRDVLLHKAWPLVPSIDLTLLVRFTSKSPERGDT